MAHKLRVEITAEDRGVFLGIQIFTAMRKEGTRREAPKPDDPLSILEQFAMFAASLLHAESNPERDLWRQAAHEQKHDAQQGVEGDAAKRAP